MLFDFVRAAFAVPMKAGTDLSQRLSSAWLFLGPSGTGKTTMAMALASEMPAELHHIPAKECTLDAVQDVCRQCHYSPRQPDNWQPVRFHLVLIDEADQMSNAAQLALLSKLDSTAFPPNTIFVFTCNATDSPPRGMTLKPRSASRRYCLKSSIPSSSGIDSVRS
jgi:DNA polymerase III delta prime subunit